MSKLTLLGVGGPIAAASSNTHVIDIERSLNEGLYAADSATVSITGNMTIEAWVKLESSPASGEEFDILSKHDQGNSANGRSWITTYENSAGTFQFRWRNSSDGTSAAQTTTTWVQTLTTGTWYHVAFVYTAAAGTVELFINGTSVSSNGSQATSIFNSTRRMTIGCRDADSATVSASWDGLIDDVRLWSTTRTGAQISANKSVELVGNETNLNGYWKLNNALTDSTANGNTLTKVKGTEVFSTDLPF